MANRIRRSENPPRFIEHEAAMHRPYRYVLPVPVTNEKATLRYRLSPWRSLAEDERIRKRELFAWIQLGRRRVGALELHEFDMRGCLANDDVLYLMDSEEDIESQIAQVLCSTFDDLSCDVMPYGSILDFRHAWIKPGPAQRELLAKAATTIIDAAFPDHALLIMKAYPLEYEGQMNDDAPIEAGLVSRQRAMVRHYHRIFGVEPLPCPHGQEGWLWRLHPKLVAPADQTEANPFF